MLVLHQSIFIQSSRHFHPNKRNGGGRRAKKMLIVSKKKEEDANKFPIKKILSQAGIGVLSLGFIDAGYSGDWSRIGVISAETEDLLKAAAFVVVPVCVYFIYVISQKPGEE